jgi:hypothetical protein
MHLQADLNYSNDALQIEISLKWKLVTCYGQVGIKHIPIEDAIACAFNSEMDQTFY